jgi:hypothetical protein
VFLILQTIKFSHHHAIYEIFKGVSRLGLLEWIGTQTENAIRNVNTESRLTVAILLILWVSGIASA